MRPRCEYSKSCTEPEETNDHKVIRPTSRVQIVYKSRARALRQTVQNRDEVFPGLGSKKFRVKVLAARVDHTSAMKSIGELNNLKARSSLCEAAHCL